MLATLVTYLINNYFIVKHGFPGVLPLLNGAFTSGEIDGEVSLQALMQAGLYLAGLLVALIYVLGNRAKSLRADASTITRINTYIIRACFWAVLFVGLADMAISFLRVEGLLGNVVNPELVKQLGRSTWRGLYVHYPLIALGFV